MEDWIKKLSAYEIINNVVPGGLALFALDWLGVCCIKDMDTLIFFLLSYIVGVVSSRIGSLVLEPVAKKLRFLEWRDYARYLDAERKDDKLQTLQTVSNMYRSFGGCLILVLIVAALRVVIPNNLIVVVSLLSLSFGLFIFAWRKQNAYIVKRIDERAVIDGENGKEGQA